MLPKFYVEFRSYWDEKDGNYNVVNEWQRWTHIGSFVSKEEALEKIKKEVGELYCMSNEMWMSIRHNYSDGYWQFRIIDDEIKNPENYIFWKLGLLEN